MENQVMGVNVAPMSTNGHFVKGAKNVINIDNINDAYFVDGGGVLVSENHTTLKLDNSCLITTQQVYNPFTALFEKSED